MRYYFKINIKPGLIFLFCFIATVIAAFYFWDSSVIYAVLALLIIEAFFINPIIFGFCIAADDMLKIKRGIFLSKNIPYKDIESVNSDNNTLTIRYNGQELNLRLQQADALMQQIQEKMNSSK